MGNSTLVFRDIPSAGRELCAATLDISADSSLAIDLCQVGHKQHYIDWITCDYFDINVSGATFLTFDRGAVNCKSQCWNRRITVSRWRLLLTFPLHSGGYEMSKVTKIRNYSR